MLPAPPRARSPSPPPPTQPRASGTRAPGSYAAPAEAAPGAWTSSRRMLRRGARRPPQSTRARMPQKFGSGSVGSEMQPKPRFPEPRANKHAQARTQTSPRPALAAAAGLGRGRPGKSPGPTRGRRSGSAAKRCDVSARRYRPGSTAQRPAWGLHRRGRRDPVGGVLGQEGGRGGRARA